MDHLRVWDTYGLILLCHTFGEEFQGLVKRDGWPERKMAWNGVYFAFVFSSSLLMNYFKSDLGNRSRYSV